MTHRIVSPLTHPSTTFHHVPESGPCAYPHSTNTVPLCDNSSKLGLLSIRSQSSFLVYKVSFFAHKKETSLSQVL